MSDKTTKAGIPTKDFSDAGTGEHFTAGKSHDFEAGAHANYLHAGLIAEPDADTAAPGEQTAA